MLFHWEYVGFLVQSCLAHRARHTTTTLGALCPCLVVWMPSEPLLKTITTKEVGTFCEFWTTSHHMDKAYLAHKLISEILMHSELFCSNLHVLAINCEIHFSAAVRKTTRTTTSLEQA
jgi:hypothetical protein